MPRRIGKPEKILKTVLAARVRLLLAIVTLLLAAAPAGARIGDYLLSGSSKWVVLASRPTLAESIEIAQDYPASRPRIMQSSNGWFAVVLGPSKAATIDDFRAGFRGPALPDDAYLAVGKNFVELVWPQAKGRSKPAQADRTDTADSGSSQLSGASRWVMLASRPTLAEAVDVAQVYSGHSPRIFQSSNGWFAVVLGPAKTATIEAFRAAFNGPDLPDDAYLAVGKNFVELVWPPAKAKGKPAAEDGPAAADASDNLLSGDRKWVVLASRPTLAEAVDIAKVYAGHRSQVMQSSNGWFAVVVGPSRAATIDDFRIAFEGPALPDDAYLAVGRNFVDRVWSAPKSRKQADAVAAAAARAQAEAKRAEQAEAAEKARALAQEADREARRIADQKARADAKAIADAKAAADARAQAEARRVEEAKAAKIEVDAKADEPARIAAATTEALPNRPDKNLPSIEGEHAPKAGDWFASLGAPDRLIERRLTFANTLYGGGLEYSFRLPRSINFVGRSGDHADFTSDGIDIRIEVEQASFASIDDAVQRIKSRPYVPAGIATSAVVMAGPTDDGMSGNHAIVKWLSTSQFRRLAIVSAACCGQFVIATIVYRDGISVDAWLDDFAASIFQARPLPVGGRNFALAQSASPAQTPAQRMYEACADLYNRDRYPLLPGFKMLAAMQHGEKVSCAVRVGVPSLAFAADSLDAYCSVQGMESCRTFAIGDMLQDWAVVERDAISSGPPGGDRGAASPLAERLPIPAAVGDGGGADILQEGVTIAVAKPPAQPATPSAAVPAAGGSATKGGSTLCVRLHESYLKCDPDGAADKAGTLNECMQVFQTQMTANGC